MKTPAFWRNNSLTSLALAPLSWLYALAAWQDRRCTTAQQAPIPVVSIGNATAGGAGKTPVALALAPMFHALGANVHYISRGYGGKTTHPRRITGEDNWQEVGDEPLLLARTAPTWVSRKRIDAITAAAQEGATLALCDDALQHHALHKDLSLLVIDGPYGIGNGRLLPAGPLREPLSTALARSDAVILIGEDRQQLAARITGLPIFHATLEPTIDPAPLRAHRWLAFAGTGRPEKFFESLRALDIPLAATRAFPDHYPYRTEDIAALRAEAASLGARLITTEKDRVKLPTADASEISLFPVQLVFRAPDAIQEFLRTWLATRTSA